jgi:hypothetical protein
VSPKTLETSLPVKDLSPGDSNSATGSANEESDPGPDQERNKSPSFALSDSIESDGIDELKVDDSIAAAEVLLENQSVPAGSLEETSGGYDAEDFDEYDANADIKNAKRVSFAPKMVSQIMYRDKYSKSESVDLFWTHNEAMKFHYDYEQEAQRAEEEGISWGEWMDKRSDADVAADDAREEELRQQELEAFDYEDWETGGDFEDNGSEDIYEF